ncbi:hypothetical protein [Cryptosporangium minutisporangium]|uniref:Uncharacterized protein n=1 Tax=Cryptosporangium minutisporangium TaxID=113569 RepID=A0ABP6T9U1_9ACTN
MPPLVLPIGQCLGAAWDPHAGARQRVRLGTQVFALDDVRFAVWALAHGAPDRPSGTTRESLFALAADLGLPAPESAFAALSADGLLADVAPANESGVAFAARHRLVPLMLGLGNTAEEPDRYRIGLPGRPIVAVDAATYGLFAWAHLETDLVAACRAAADRAAAGLPIGLPSAAGAGSAAGADGDWADEQGALAASFGGLHPLLAANAAYLDRALGAGH